MVILLPFFFSLRFELRQTRMGNMIMQQQVGSFFIVHGMGGNYSNLNRPHYKCGLVMGTLTKMAVIWVGE